MRTGRQLHQRPKEEETLLSKIKQDLPSELRHRYKELKRKQRAETLTTGEHQEIQRITHQVEELGVQRLQALLELARLRETTLDALIKKLGVKPRCYE